MKRSTQIIMTLAVMATSAISFSQARFSMTSKGSFDNKELRELLNFNEMDFYQIAITGEQFKNRNYYIVSKEIWKGEIKKTDTIFNSREHEVFKNTKDTLRFMVMGGKTDAKKLKIQFSFDRFGVSRTYKCSKSNDYSLRDFGSRSAIVAGKPFYAFAYILPTEHKDGSKSWCEVEADGADIENWGRKFNIEHYLLFEMRFE